LGRETGKDDRKHLIRGRLSENVTQGKDKGALSAKILGSDSELNLWQPEMMTGVIVLQQPSSVSDKMLEEPPDPDAKS
jgi:hypothetical protein